MADENEKKPEPMLSPFMQRVPPMPKTIVKNLNIEVNEHGGNQFIEMMAEWFLYFVGMGAALVFTAYAAYTAADWVGTIAFSVWNLACVLAILEHSREARKKKDQTKAEVIIKRAIEQFTKV
jgi:hypothetical protein